MSQTTKVDQHIYPVADLKEHICGDDDSCWCKPNTFESELTGEIIAVHHAADNRGMVESGTGKDYLQ